MTFAAPKGLYRRKSDSHRLRAIIRKLLMLPPIQTLCQQRLMCRALSCDLDLDLGNGIHEPSVAYDEPL